MPTTAPDRGVTLRHPANLVSRRATLFWTVRAAPGWVVLIAALVLWTVWDGDHRAWQVVGLAVAALLAAVHLSVMPRWRYRVHRWETTPLAVYTQSGWFNQERRIAPLTRIQTVDLERGPLEQLFKLANVTVTTASAAGPLHINGLDHATAEQLVHDLTAATEQAPGDAT